MLLIIQLIFLILIPIQENPLDELQWKNRIILLYAPDELNETYKSQVGLFSEKPKEIQERDLVILSVFEESGKKAESVEITSGWEQAVKKQYFAEEDSFKLILIGKDGGEKLVEEELVSPNAIFDLIDQMPMRQTEMKKN